jgi:DNA polymerase-1
MPLYLVDGHALAYRSYFAFANQPLVNSKGEETSAVYGFLNTLLALLTRFAPEYIAVAFDSTVPTFRHQRFEAYKAHREEIPDSLRAQLPVIMAVLDAMRIPRFAVERYEADDIIATFVKRWESRERVDIVSGDKDLFQLISERTRVIRPGRGGVLENELGPEGLLELLGVRPDQVVDYLALVGDTSDNVPGVRGIGQKTARKLLAEYGSLDEIYRRLDAVKPPGVQRKLRAEREAAMLSRELVTLSADAPVEAGLEDLALRDHRSAELRSLLEDLEFVRMVGQIFEGEGLPPPPTRAGNGAAPDAPVEEVDYRLVDTEEALARLATDLVRADVIAVDVETSGLDAMRAVLAGISVATAPGRAWYVPVASEIDEDADAGGQRGLLPAPRAPGLPVETVRRYLSGVFAAPSPQKAGQNVKYDAVVLSRAGLPLGGVTFDTMIASYCLDPSRRSHSLDALALEVLGHEMIPFASLFPSRGRRKDIRTAPLERVKDYACEDADFTLRLAETFEPQLEASQVGHLFRDVEMPLVHVLTAMEQAGVRVDVDFLSRLSSRYAEEIASIEARIYEVVGERFNINSTQKLREILFGRLGLKPARRTKTGYSTDVDVLTALSGEHEVVELLLEYRQKVKLKSTYIDALPRLVHPETGRVHTSYNQAVATTGRLSSSDPNLQNIPIRSAEGREIRRAFVASGEDWVLLDADYSQIELRILTHLSGDDELRRAFLEDADVHRRTAALVMKVAPEEVTDDMRGRAKAVNFGIVYGMGARGLAQSLDIEIDEARRFIDDYFRSYPGVKRFIDETISEARERRCVSTLLGRLRQVPDIDSSNPGSRAFSERIAVNTRVQGTAAEVIKLAMLEIDREVRQRGLSSRMILQVHDELLFDVRRDELEEMKELVRTAMESAIEMSVPLKVDMGVGESWFEAH